MTDATTSSPTDISAEELKRLVDSGEPFHLVDTRDVKSFNEWRLAGATHFFYKPDRAFDPDTFRSETGLTPEDPVVTICAKGLSSGALAEELVDAGYEDVRHVNDGMRGWSAVYDTVNIDTDGSVEIVQLQRRAKGCLGYLVADPETGAAAAVDPTRHVGTVREAAAERGFEIERVFDTHIHADHLSGGRRLADALGVPYHLGERVAERDPDFEYRPLRRNEVLAVGDVDVKALFTPGHTSGMVSYLVGEEALLTGDTVFIDGVGRTELQFGDEDAASGAALLYESLQGTVLAEPDPVTVLPGHFSVSNDGAYGAAPGSEVSTTVRALRTELSILHDDRGAFSEHVVESAPEKPPNYERIIAINRGRSAATEDEAIELELGPNRCAAE
ncbi:MAG: glyoxylase-like metal-dependent hydrolase (beta-lactamase superfamily II) [Natronomonas sp.]|jgi:thiosulfate/3-mercaptopyruvate sulfurtransferase|uniref:MBL fold metallo-hydrolase n=1 Tax=Natronomonas sp. TaxID=2184060 RepID=UPI003988AD3A